MLHNPYELNDNNELIKSQDEEDNDAEDIGLDIINFANDDIETINNSQNDNEVTDVDNNFLEQDRLMSPFFSDDGNDISYSGLLSTCTESIRTIQNENLTTRRNAT